MTTANVMRLIGARVKAMIPRGYGFALIVFREEKPGLANYISSARREDMIKGFRETADRLEKNEIFPTPEAN